MSRPTPLEQVIDAIMLELKDGDSEVPYHVGAHHLSMHGESRRIVFVPTSGRFKLAKGGTVQVATKQSAVELITAPLTVEAHVICECFGVTWLLWQNLLNATRSVFNGRHTSVAFNWPQSAPDAATSHTRTIACVQTFEWDVTAWEGIIPLPPDCNVETFVATRQMQEMLTFKKTGRLVTDPNEPL